VINLPPVADAGGPRDGIANVQAVTFDAGGSTGPDGSIVSRAWDVGDGSSTPVATTTVSHMYTAAGTYTATLTRATREAPRPRPPSARSAAVRMCS
jgi:hypothetical protein